MDDYFDFYIYSLSLLPPTAFFCFGVFPHIQQHAHKGQRTTFKGWLSPSTFTWVMGIELLSGYQAWWQMPSTMSHDACPRMTIVNETFIDI